MRVIGIDPGSRACGYSVLEIDGETLSHLISGTIIPSQNYSLQRKLQIIYEKITEIIGSYTPNCMSIEEMFFAKNAKSAIKLGQARGVALLAAANSGLDVYEYAPTKIKLALTGKGRANKEEVKRMLQHIFGIDEKMRSDQSDAIAIALCHINFSKSEKITGLNLRSYGAKRRRFTIDDLTSQR